jgi:NDP-sugar pyrophosphorylase family protein
LVRRRFKTGFILGAGLGTRLRPLTEERPKPLLPIGGRPIITYAMDHLLTVGVDRIIARKFTQKSFPKNFGVVCP